VCLQEVEPELWAMLERHVPGACSFVFAPHPNRPDGVAIISRLESIGPQSPITVLGYGAAFDEYFIEGEIVTVASMHLPFNDDPTWPSAILRDVLGFFSRSEFAVIGLDANAPWASPVFDALRQRDWMGGDTEPTCYSNGRWKVSDHVVARGGPVHSIAGAFVEAPPTRRWPSDHLPVTSVVSF
jgi:hypothetical protein